MAVKSFGFSGFVKIKNMKLNRKCGTDLPSLRRLGQDSENVPTGVSGDALDRVV